MPIKIAFYFGAYYERLSSPKMRVYALYLINWLFPFANSIAETTTVEGVKKQPTTPLVWLQYSQACWINLVAETDPWILVNLINSSNVHLINHLIESGLPFTIEFLFVVLKKERISITIEFASKDHFLYSPTLSWGGNLSAIDNAIFRNVKYSTNPPNQLNWTINSCLGPKSWIKLSLSKMFQETLLNYFYLPISCSLCMWWMDGLHQQFVSRV